MTGIKRNLLDLNPECESYSRNEQIALSVANYGRNFPGGEPTNVERSISAKWALQSGTAGNYNHGGSYSTTPNDCSPARKRKSLMSDNSSEEEEDIFPDLQVVALSVDNSQNLPPKLSDLPNLVLNCRFLSETSDGVTPKFAPLDRQQMGNPLANQRQILATICSVKAAISTVFGDQIAAWTAYRDDVARTGTLIQPETDVGSMAVAVNNHTIDHASRVEKFASLLPGISNLDVSTKQSMTLGWKAMAATVLHHALFMTEDETYFTVGPNKYRYCRYWQENPNVMIWSLQVFFYKFCTEVRQLGLTQTELYLLMAVVILEPDNEAAVDVRTNLIHRHYVDALLHLIQLRCVDVNEWTTTCKKVQRYFGMLKTINRVHQYYFSPNAKLF